MQKQFEEKGIHFKHGASPQSAAVSVLGKSLCSLSVLASLIVCLCLLLSSYTFHLSPPPFLLSSPVLSSLESLPHPSLI